jgi:uncharacterized protein (DUF1330 family)
VRGGRSEAPEGLAWAHNAVLEFADDDTARGYYHSQQYQMAKAIRAGAAQIEMVLIEGV